MLRDTPILSSHAGKNYNSWYCFLTYLSPNQNDIVDRKKSIMRTFKSKKYLWRKSTRDVYKTWFLIRVFDN